MTIEPTHIVEQGRSAWERLRSRQRATWDEWLDVGRAIIIGHTEALKSANTNRASARRRPSVVLLGQNLQRTAEETIDFLLPDFVVLTFYCKAVRSAFWLFPPVRPSPPLFEAASARQCGLANPNLPAAKGENLASCTASPATQ